MKKSLILILISTVLLTLVNCSTTQYHAITKTEKDMYAVEVTEAKWMWFYVPFLIPFTSKNYLALCKAEANGNLVCEAGEGSITGFGAAN